MTITNDYLWLYILQLIVLLPNWFHFISHNFLHKCACYVTSWMSHWVCTVCTFKKTNGSLTRVLFFSFSLLLLVKAPTMWKLTWWNQRKCGHCFFGELIVQYNEQRFKCEFYVMTMFYTQCTAQDSGQYRVEWLSTIFLNFKDYARLSVRYIFRSSISKNW